MAIENNRNHKNKKQAMALVVILVVITTLSLVIVGSIKLTTMKSGGFSYNRNRQDAITKREGIFICYEDQSQKGKYVYKINNDEINGQNSCSSGITKLNSLANIAKKTFTVTLVGGGAGGICADVKESETSDNKACYQNLKISKNSVEKVEITKIAFVKNNGESNSTISDIGQISKNYFMNENGTIKNIFDISSNNFKCPSWLKSKISEWCSKIEEEPDNKKPVSDYRVNIEYSVRLNNDYNNIIGDLKTTFKYDIAEGKVLENKELYLKQCIQKYTIYNPYAGAKGNFVQKNISNIKEFKTIQIGKGGDGGNAKKINLKIDNAQISDTKSKSATILEFVDTNGNTQSLTADPAENSGSLTSAEFNQYDTQQQKITKKNENKLDSIAKYTSEISQYVNFGSGGGYDEFQYTPNTCNCFTDTNDGSCETSSCNTTNTPSTSEGYNGTSGAVIIEW